MNNKYTIIVMQDGREVDRFSHVPLGGLHLAMEEAATLVDASKTVDFTIVNHHHEVSE